MSEPELIIKSAAIDLEIEELLGSKPRDFIVTCFDGVQFESYGTPYDTPANRATAKALCNRLNDRSSKSLWPEMWRRWSGRIIEQFKLPQTATAKDYHPTVSFKISRVCPGYSQRLPVAIGLFETLSAKIDEWSVVKTNGNYLVRIVGVGGERVLKNGDSAPLTIAEAIREFLKK